MSRTLKAAIGSTCSKPGQLQTNMMQIGQLAEQAVANGCRLLLTPEMSATGYGGYDSVLAMAEEPGQGAVYESLALLAGRTGIVITAGYVEKNGQHRHIAHYAVYPDGSFISQRKHRATPAERPLEPGVDLFYDDTEEIGHVHPGQENFVTFKIDGITCGIVICADNGVHNLSSILQELGVEMMLLPVGAGGHREHKVSAEELKTEQGLAKYRELLKRNALPQEGAMISLQYKRATLAVNMSGFDGIERYHGGSGSIVSSRGEVLAYIPDQPILDYQRPSFSFAELVFE